jgi:heme-degrading monooxygenase HmoA
MIKMYVRHKVADFDKWKIVFEEVEPFRKQSGSSGAHIFRNNANPNDVLVVTDWDNREQGMRFGQSSELKKALERAGVIGAPEISFARSEERRVGKECDR